MNFYKIRALSRQYSAKIQNASLNKYLFDLFEELCIFLQCKKNSTEGISIDPTIFKLLADYLQ